MWSLVWPACRRGAQGEVGQREAFSADEATQFVAQTLQFLNTWIEAVLPVGREGLPFLGTQSGAGLYASEGASVSSSGMLTLCAARVMAI
ncbi:hypothetical protein HHA01_28050 [Halomonas halmophila]|uniref:Uncharacterized protein n=1 Tax=Halomonas halmophila TaxID=252 RepID=A0A4Y4F9R0_9GAMM|nr:hypothetical protein HHA01_28050 [Halomonas halmophila]